MIIDDKTLKNLIGFTDDIGILSLYVGYLPQQAADPQPTTPIAIRNQIRDLRKRLRDERPHDVWHAVEKRLDALDDGDLSRLLDPKAHGRGRALFVAVSDGRTEDVAIQMPFAERVVFDDSPYVRPLVAAYDEGREAGIIVVSRTGVRLLQWAIGECEELDRWEFELTDAQLADVKSGPSANNPRQQQEGLVNRERFEDRIDENRSRFFKDVLADIRVQHEQHGWDRLVVSGSPKLRDAAVDWFPAGNGLRVLRAEHDWESLTPAQIAERAWPVLRSVVRDRERDLVDAALDRALAGGAGAVGMRNVCNALNQGQVSHLLFRADLEATGYATDEGTLHADVSGPAAQAGFEMHRDTLFVERLVEKTIEMGGQVTPIDGEEAAAKLDEHDGIAAILRW